ncbi:Tom37 C-terminal domain-containing protein [Cryomyces antarcticus]
MVLELHVWGPAFGLPSIDAECIAAACYLKQCLSSDTEEDKWTIVAGHDPSSNPSGASPALRDGREWVCGFNAITAHLKTRFSHRFDDLSAEQIADSTAWTAFIQSAARPLLDLSLYVSFENYRLTTRPAFTHILPWHANYIIPPKRRAAARARTEHLGLSALDVDTVHDVPDNASPPKSGADREIEGRASLLLPRKNTVRSMLAKPEYAARFRLDTVMNALFAPLHALLGHKEYLLGGKRPSALDCLAFGYLALMTYPPVPQNWLQETMERKWPKLSNYTNRMRRIFLGDGVDPRSMEGVNSRNQSFDGELALPWQPFQHQPLTNIIVSICQDVLSRMPFFQTPRVIHRQLPHSSKKLPQATPLPQILVLATGAVATVAYLAHYLLNSNSGEADQQIGIPHTRLEDLGEAGAALDAMFAQMDHETASYVQRDARRRPEEVEADLEIEHVEVAAV